MRSPMVSERGEAYRRGCGGIAVGDHLVEVGGEDEVARLLEDAAIAVLVAARLGFGLGAGQLGSGPFGDVLDQDGVALDQLRAPWHGRRARRPCGCS